VTDGKICLWLEEEIFFHGNRSHGVKKGTKLSDSGVEAYVKPVIDLYEVSYGQRPTSDLSFSDACV
jgi:hypothetical protein